jgi:CDP-glycerol glycerophosphotransferase
MFDFAVTGKPMIFYPYDLPHYRDRLRGFRLDYLAEVPGPVVMTTEELLRAIRDVAAVVPRHAERYARFRAAYSALDDGRATQRVLQRCFGIDPPSVQVVILAAGMGTRLGRSGPKPLTTLASGQTILHRQVDGVREVLGAHVPVTIVVGYQADVVREAVPGVWFAHNEHYHRTNTSKSLLRGLERAGTGGVLWMNGDVVFDPAILEHVRPWIEADESFVCVNTASVAEEEIKYTVDAEGCIAELSKTVTGGLGEAVGINYVSSRDRATLARYLRIAGDGDYFERGMELAIEAGHLRFRPVDISAYGAVEVDVEDDLAHANLRLFGAGVRVAEEAR